LADGGAADKVVVMNKRIRIRACFNI